MTQERVKEYQRLDQAFDDLFPLMRSITGPGIETSIDYLRAFMDLDVIKVPSGTTVFDWSVPEEWHFQRTRLWGPDGALVCDSDQHTLHVLNYSQPIDQTLSLEALQSHLHSLPDLQTAIPYVTSYYKRTWGICLAEQQRAQLSPGDYRVLIESEFKAGGVPYATGLLPGDSLREVMLTSYLCHPSMANNELSGPLVMLALYERIKRWPRRRYSYRFTLNPETIGSLCFLSHYHEHLRKTLTAGFILTCLGGPAPQLRYKASRQGIGLGDRLAHRVASGLEGGSSLPLRYQDFSPRGGSDERQYCAPGFNLPVGQFARTVYGSFPGYHNSLDDKAFMGIERLIETVDTLEDFLKLLDVTGTPVNQAPYGEPQLGKRGLYPNLNAASTRKHSGDAQVDARVQLNWILTILSLADGSISTMEMADACECTLAELRPTLELLEAHGLLDYQGEPLV